MRNPSFFFAYVLPSLLLALLPVLSAPLSMALAMGLWPKPLAVPRTRLQCCRLRER